MKITDYKTLFNAFKKAVYGYYYNDIYTQKQSLSRLKSKLPLNCADLNQLAYAALKELNYEFKLFAELLNVLLFMGMFNVGSKLMVPC